MNLPRVLLLTWRRILICGGFIVGIFISLQALPASDCEEWNTDSYFVGATLQEINRCVAKGKDPNVTDADGITPFFRAVMFSKNPAVVEALLAGGASVDATTGYDATIGYGITPLHAAVWENANLAVVEALLGAGASVDATNDGGYTPLHTACLAVYRSGCSRSIAGCWCERKRDHGRI